MSPSKRRYGTGSVYQRADGRWCAKLIIPGAGTKYLYGRTRAEADAKLRDARKRVALDMPLMNDRYKLEDFLLIWLRDVVSAGRASTYEAYRQRLADHVVPRIGHVPLLKLNPQHVQGMMTQAIGSGLSPRTVRELRGVLRAALNVAVKWGYVERNVAALVDPPKVETFEGRSLSAPEALGFLSHVRGHRFEALFVLSLALGMRQGEILGLRWDDIDLDAGTLEVKVQLQQVRGKLQFVELKTKASRRPLALPAFVVQALREHRTRQLEQRLHAGKRWEEWRLVFPSSIGTPMSARNLDREFYVIREALGLQDLRFHDLRHSAGTLLRLQGVDIKTIQLMLGHASYSTTMNVYQHMLPDEMKEAARRLDLLYGAS